MYTCLHRHCVFFYEVCNGEDESNQSALYPLYNQYWTVLSDLCVFVVCQFNIMSWIEVMDSLLDVSQSMLYFVDRVGKFKFVFSGW